MVLLAELLFVLLGRIDRGVNFPPEFVLDDAQTGHDLTEFDVADDHEIDVARRCLLAPRDRSVNERNCDSRKQRFKRFLNDITDASGFRQDTLELAEDRIGWIRLVINLMATPDSLHQPASSEQTQLSLCGSECGFGSSHKLAQVELLVAVTVKKREDCTACFTEKETASSDIDLMVIGDVKFSEVVSCLTDFEKKLGREINPTVYPPEEYKTKIRDKNHFLTSTLREKKIFVIGDEDELRRLG